MFAVLSDPAIYEFENQPPASEQALWRRYVVLERRRSPDGEQTWLNWIIRLPSGIAVGYVQATILQTGTAYIAYELASRHWGQGIGSAAVTAMLSELRLHYGVTLYVAVLKQRNHRSLALLRKLGFLPASGQESAELAADPDELVMTRTASDPPASD